MPLFSHFFGGTRKHGEKGASGPLYEIGKALLCASAFCADATKGLIDVNPTSERQKREIFIFYEFLYFFMHLTMRSAFAQLTPKQTADLQELLGSTLSSTAIERHFSHWPDVLKQKMTDEFFEKLNDAEREYTTCSDADQKQTMQKLFWKVSSNVALLAGHSEKDIAILIPIMEASMTAWTEIKLAKLVANAKQAL